MQSKSSLEEMAHVEKREYLECVPQEQIADHCLRRLAPDMCRIA